MSRLVLARLSVMMFLQFFVWGSWYATVGNYMASHTMSHLIWAAFSVGPIAAIAAPLFLGLVADRYFATERVLAVLHLIGGVVIFAAPYQTEWNFIGILLIHMLCYMPTLGLTNTLAFHHIRDQEKDFPVVRVAGTLGWIAAGILVSKILKADTVSLQFQVAGWSGLVLAAFSLTLPHTPPPAKGQPASVSTILGLDSLKLMKSPSFAVFLISSFLVSIPLSAYYAYAQVFVKDAGAAEPAFLLSFGQMSEVFFMLAMPLFFARLGVKWMLMVGMAAWVARYALFAGTAATGTFWMVFIGILLHGICYDFFFVTGYIYVDKRADKQMRGQAQSLLVLVTQGLGMLIGTQICGLVFRRLSEVPENPALTMSGWQTFWMIPSIMALVILVLFSLLFRDETSQVTENDGDPEPGQIPVAQDVI